MYKLITKPTSKSNEFEVTILLNGKPIKTIIIVSTSPDSAYFNDNN